MSQVYHNERIKSIIITAVSVIPTVAIGGSAVARLGGRIGKFIALYDLIDSERVGRTYWLKVGLIELTALRPTHDATHKAVAPNVNNSLSRSTAG